MEGGEAGQTPLWGWAGGRNPGRAKGAPCWEEISAFFISVGAGLQISPAEKPGFLKKPGFWGVLLPTENRYK